MAKQATYAGSERFTDAGLHVTPWTEELALRQARATGLTRDEALAVIRTAVDNDDLPEQAVEALVKAGWTELEA